MQGRPAETSAVRRRRHPSTAPYTFPNSQLPPLTDTDTHTASRRLPQQPLKWQRLLWPRHSPQTHKYDFSSTVSLNRQCPPSFSYLPRHACATHTHIHTPQIPQHLKQAVLCTSPTSSSFSTLLCRPRAQGQPPAPSKDQSRTCTHTRIAPAPSQPCTHSPLRVALPCTPCTPTSACSPYSHWRTFQHSFPCSSQPAPPPQTPSG